mmetsp:Transcript_11007/g.28721  ORF Transcript_11007/g.28721 Transcript_11007/m.28721 type:complete len:198 (-) Transcript_11007:54-647(-)
MATAAAAALLEAGWVAPPDGWPSSEPVQALVQLQSKVICNCFGLLNTAGDGAETGPLEGWGVWPAISLFNHSCVPSLYLEFGGKASERGRITVRALRPIPAGGPLTIAYGRGAGRQSREERESTMREHWRFECRCERCLHSDKGEAEQSYEFAAFDAEFLCRRCCRIGPPRAGPAASGKGTRPGGCSCVRARNRLSG